MKQAVLNDRFGSSMFCKELQLCDCTRAQSVKSPVRLDRVVFYLHHRNKNANHALVGIN